MSIFGRLALIFLHISAGSALVCRLLCPWNQGHRRSRAHVIQRQAYGTDWSTVGYHHWQKDHHGAPHVKPHVHILKEGFDPWMEFGDMHDLYHGHSYLNGYRQPMSSSFFLNRQTPMPQFPVTVHSTPKRPTFHDVVREPLVILPTKARSELPSLMSRQQNINLFGRNPHHSTSFATKQKIVGESKTTRFPAPETTNRHLSRETTEQRKKLAQEAALNRQFFSEFWRSVHDSRGLKQKMTRVHSLEPPVRSAKRYWTPLLNHPFRN